MFSPKDAAPERRRGISISALRDESLNQAYRRNLEHNSRRESSKRGLQKRALAPLPITAAGMDAFMTGIFSKPTTQQLDNGVTESNFIDLTTLTTPWNYGLKDLCGCTALVVVSREAMYIAHF
jgi:hypothetical protein